MNFKTNNLEDINIKENDIYNLTVDDNENISFWINNLSFKNYKTVPQAKITFISPRFSSMKYYGYKKCDNDGNVVDIVLDRYILVDEIVSEISNMIDLFPCIYRITRKKSKYTLTLFCEHDVIDVTLSFKGCIIEEV
ncbi:MAG: hypothetical protein ACI4WH_05020 [Oscillospiraceae bacterium]